MKLYSENESYKLYQGSMLDMLEVIEPNSIDSIITDPPYELNFMGKGWDNSGIAFQKETWEKCYEVLKSGGYLLAFGGSRTFHRIACAIEDAGFEIRDTIMWLYGSGFPKSMDISKSLDKRNGRKNNDFIELGNYLREKRGNKTQKEISKYFPSKTGGLTGCVSNWEKGENIPTKEQYAKLKEILNLDDRFDWLIEREEAEREVIGTKQSGCFNNQEKDKYTIGSSKSLEVDITIPSTDLAKQWQGWGTALKPSFEPIIVARKPFKGSLVDNVIEYGVGGINIDECRVGNEVIKGGTMPDFRDIGQKSKEAIGIDKLSFGQVENAKRKPLDDHIGRFPANTILTYDETDFDEVCGGFPYTKGDNRTTKQTYDKSIWGNAKSVESNCLYADSGSASRYFMNCKYTGKDEEIWKQLLVNNVESNLEILKATKDNIVQMNVEDLLKELKDHYAKYVDNQLDLIETPIVQDIVEILTWDFKIETSQVIQDFIINSKKCIQFLNLVQFVEKMDNIDTTQTTQNLLKLFGYVKVVITNYIIGNIKLEQRRYLYTPKASKKDRDEGLDTFNEEKVNDGRNTPIDNAFQRGETLRKNIHPTVKPTELMQYLVRLVAPNNGIVLDPFNGSGSTGKAVMYENRERNKNYKYIGIELTDEYLPISKARIEYVCNLEPEKDNQMTIFDFIGDDIK